MSWFRPPSDRAAALLWRTRVRLSAVTLLMVAALVLAVGVVSAYVAIDLMRSTVDRALDAAASDPVTTHSLLDGEGSYDDGGRLVQADTFVMLVSASGSVYATTSQGVLAGLPDQQAIASAAADTDRRTGRYGDLVLRLRTSRLDGADVEYEYEDDHEDGAGGTTELYIQAGYDLSLERAFERQLVAAIGLIGLLGIAGAIVVTLVVTRRALAPIREAFETERRFVATASHELRTPVAIIRASAEILEREGLVVPGGQPLVDDIVGETDRVGRLVGDLMALASAEAGAISMDLEPIDLEAYFVDIGRRCASIAEARGVRFQTSTSGLARGVHIEADRDRLDQLLLILVDNALRHSPAGGLVRLSLTVDLAARTVTIAVTDEGPGIPAGELERIFEPFTRSRGSGRSGDGAGLGLAIARQLAQRQSARLDVHSEPGHGATFRLRLPLW